MAVFVPSVFVVILAISWVGYELWYRPTILYKPHNVPMKFERKAGGQFQVPFEEVLGPQATKYREFVDEGQGLAIEFETDGKPELPNPFIPLEAAETGDTDVDVRGKEMAAALAKLKEHVNALNNPPAVNTKFMFFLDDTNGVGEDMKPFLQARITDLGIDELAKRDNVTLYFHRLTSSFFYQSTKPRVVKIAAKSAAGAGANDINAAIEDLTQVRGKQMYSSIATGFFNALAENGVDANTRVIVISDGLEHTPETAQLDSKFLTPAQVEASASGYIAKLQSIKPAPDFKGARIDWYLPPRTEKARLMMTVLEKIWVPLLRDEKHAQVTMHF